MRGDDDENRWGPEVRASLLVLILILLAIGGYFLFLKFSGVTVEREVRSTAPTEEQTDNLAHAAVDGLRPSVTDSGLALPEGIHPQLSPDGTLVSFLRYHQGTLNIFVAPRGDLGQARAVTSFTSDGVLHHQWAFNGTHILFRRQADGASHIFSLDVITGSIRDLIPFEGREAGAPILSPWHPDEMLVEIGSASRGPIDLHRIHIVTGESFLEERGGAVSHFLADKDFIIRAGTAPSPDGFSILARRESGWERLFSVSRLTDGGSRVLFLGAGHDLLYMLDSRDRRTAALVSIDLATGERFVLAESDAGDIASYIANPATNEIFAYAVDASGLEWRALDLAIAPDIDRLQRMIEGDFRITSQTLDNSLWVVEEVTPLGEAIYHLYDRNTAALEQLLTANRAPDPPN